VNADEVGAIPVDRTDKLMVCVRWQQLWVASNGLCSCGSIQNKRDNDTTYILFLSGKDESDKHLVDAIKEAVTTTTTTHE
jgi:hypothetical protein